MSNAGSMSWSNTSLTAVRNAVLSMASKVIWRPPYSLVKREATAPNCPRRGSVTISILSASFADRRTSNCCFTLFKASVQLVVAHLPSPLRPTRTNGVRMRSG